MFDPEMHMQPGTRESGAAEKRGPNAEQLAALFEECPGRIAVLIPEPAQALRVRGKLEAIGVPAAAIDVVPQGFDPGDERYVLAVVDPPNLAQLRCLDRSLRADIRSLLVFGEKAEGKAASGRTDLQLKLSTPAEQAAAALLEPLFELLAEHDALSHASMPPPDREQGACEKARQLVGDRRILVCAQGWSDFIAEDFFRGVIEPHTSRGLRRFEAYAEAAAALAQVEQDPSAYAIALSQTPGFLLQLSRKCPDICRIFIWHGRYLEGRYMDAAAAGAAHGLITSHHMPPASLAGIIEKSCAMLSRKLDLSSAGAPEDLLPSSYRIM